MVEMAKLWDSIGVPRIDNAEQPAPEPPAPSIADLLADVAEALRALGQQPALKGDPVRMFSTQTSNVLSDKAVDCDGFNAVHVDVEVNGTAPSATISVEGGIERGSSRYFPLPDPAAKQPNVTADLSFDCMVGSRWAKVRLADISGTFADGGGYTVTATPFVAPSGTSLVGRLVTLAASAARTSGANGTALLISPRVRRWIFVLDVTALAAGGGDSLDVYVDVSLDNSKWLNALHFTQQTGAGSAATLYAILDPANPGTSVINATSDAGSGVVRPSAWGPYIRARWAIAGGTANFTFSVVGFGQE